MPIDEDVIAWLLKELQAGRRLTLEELKQHAPDQETLERMHSIRELFPTPDDWQADAVICRHYRLLRRIGQGGAGEVWLAERSGEEQTPVVLKRALGPQSKSVAAASLTRIKERAMISDLAAGMALPQHPHIITYHGFEMHEDALVVVMDHANRGSAGDQIDSDSTALSWGNLVRWATQSAWGLAFMHIHGLIHQDVKPGNILLRETDGVTNALISDFGLVQTPTAETFRNHRLSRAATRGLTRNYASPEQHDGDDLTVRSDTYSWAKTWIHFGTGDPHADPDDLSLWEKRLGPAPRPQAAQDLLKLLRECLNEDPMERPNLSEAAYAMRFLVKHLDPEAPAIDLPRQTRSGIDRSEASREQAMQITEQLNTRTTAGLLGVDQKGLSAEEKADLETFLSAVHADAVRLFGVKASMYLRNEQLDRALDSINVAELHALEGIESPEGRRRANGIACALLELVLATDAGYRERSSHALRRALDKALYILDELQRLGPLDRECRELLSLIFERMSGEPRMYRRRNQRTQGEEVEKRHHSPPEYVEIPMPIRSGPRKKTHRTSNPPMSVYGLKERVITLLNHGSFEDE